MGRLELFPATNNYRYVIIIRTRNARVLQNAGPSEFGRGRVFPQLLPPRRRDCVTGPARSARIHPRPHEIGSPSNIIIRYHVQAELYSLFENVKNALLDASE